MPAEDQSRERDLARARDLSRERLPPGGPDDRTTPPPTAERFLPPRRGGRNSKDESWYTAEWAGGDDPGAAAAEAESLASRGTPPEESLPRAEKGSSGAAGRPKRPEPGSTLDSGGSKAQEAPEGAAGPELARAVLDAALAKRRENAARSPRRRSGTGEGSGKRPRGYSGPGPDPRDPQLFGAVLERLMKARGWERPKAEATVFGAWERVVGEEIAQHSRPVKLDAGVLTVEAESTAWATQLRLLAATLLRNIAGEVGHNVVTRLNIHGPAAPSWSRGPRRVQGRGPRDTYG